MVLDLARNWWVLLIRGLAAIAFGILAFMWPGISLLALVVLYGAYALIDGVAALALAFTSGRGGAPWWGMVLVGVAGIAAAVVTFLWPGITAFALLMIIAAWSIVRGIMEIVAAIRLRQVLRHEWLLALAGAISIAWGLLLVARPAAGALALVWVIGAFAIAFGIVAVTLAIRLRMMTAGTHWRTAH
jgi:uncharacterized membrane protein HdeD (DUF308 family)